MAHKADLGGRLRIAAAAILLLGMGSALALHLTAGEPAETSMVDRFENSKVFRHEVEAYGGKASVLANDFTRWFERLWERQNLGETVAWLTVALAVILLLAARAGTAGDSTGAGRERDEGSRNDTAP